MCCAGRLFSNQVRKAGIDWRDAMSIDRPLHPSISQPAEALTQDGTAGRGEREGDRFKRSPLGDSLLLTESFIRPRKKSSEVNLTANFLFPWNGNVKSWYNYEFSSHSGNSVISKCSLYTICDFIWKLKSFNQQPSFLDCQIKPICQSCWSFWYVHKVAVVICATMKQQQPCQTANTTQTLLFESTCLTESASEGDSKRAYRCCLVAPFYFVSLLGLHTEGPVRFSKELLS